MDEIDSQIINQLCHNCRLSPKDIAVLLKKPRHIVDYRIKRLREQGVLLRRELVVNYPALGYQEYIVYLKIFHFVKHRERLLTEFKKIPNLRWCAEVFPRFNLRLVILAKNIAGFQKTFQQIEDAYGDIFVEKEVLVGTNFEKFETYTTKKPLSSNESIHLDEVDESLLHELAKDAGQSYYALSKTIGLSLEGTRKRVQRLLTSNVILGTVQKVEMTKLGFSFWTNFTFQLNDFEKHKVRLKEFLYSDSSFGRTRRTFGKWNVEMTIFVTSYNQLVEKIYELEKTFGQDFEGFEMHIYNNSNSIIHVPSLD